MEKILDMRGWYTPCACWHRLAASASIWGRRRREIVVHVVDVVEVMVVEVVEVVVVEVVVAVDEVVLVKVVVVQWR